MGAIPLTGLTILELDDKDRKDSVIGKAASTVAKVNRLLLITATGAKTALEAVTIEERDSWVTHLRVAVASLEVPS